MQRAGQKPAMTLSMLLVFQPFVEREDMQDQSGVVVQKEVSQRAFAH